MNMQNIIQQKICKVIRQNFIFYLTGFLIVVGMKYFYSNAECGNLVWILAPIAKWVELLSGIPFEYTPGAGYANHSLRLLIAPSCSGVQFMIITAAMLIFSFVHRVTTSPHTDFSRSSRFRKGFCWIVISIALSYLFTIFVNGLRIIMAIYLPVFLGETVYNDFLTPDRLHTIIGITVYFTALLTIYRLAQYFFSGNAGFSENAIPSDTSQRIHPQKDDTPQHNRQQPSIHAALNCAALPQFMRKCLPPVFWYLSIALGIPFINNAYQKSGGKFTEFALLIFCCCTAILTLYSLVLLLGSCLKKSRHK